MTITQLRYVIAVANYKNFTRAAEHEEVTQPTLSMQIQKLEEELDTPIFNRKKKPLVLTPVGERIVVQAKRILDESEKMQDIIEQQKGYVGGKFKLGIIPSILPNLLPVFIRKFSTHFPLVELEIEAIPPEILSSKILKGELDAGITITPQLGQQLKKWVLYYEPICAYIPENTSLFTRQLDTPEVLKEAETLLLPQKGNPFRESLLNRYPELGTTGTSGLKIRSNSYSTLCNLCDEGLGVTLLPLLGTLNLSDDGRRRIKRFQGPEPALEVSLIYTKRELKKHIITALYDTITAALHKVIQYEEVDILNTYEN